MYSRAWIIISLIIHSVSLLGPPSPSFHSKAVWQSPSDQHGILRTHCCGRWFNSHDGRSLFQCRPWWTRLSFLSWILKKWWKEVEVDVCACYIFYMIPDLMWCWWKESTMGHCHGCDYLYTCVISDCKMEQSPSPSVNVSCNRWPEVEDKTTWMYVVGRLMFPSSARQHASKLASFVQYILKYKRKKQF